MKINKYLKIGEAAKFLGIKYTTLHEKVKKYNIKFSKNPVED